MIYGLTLRNLHAYSAIIHSNHGCFHIVGLLVGVSNQSRAHPRGAEDLMMSGAKLFVCVIIYIPWFLVPNAPAESLLAWQS